MTDQTARFQLPLLSAGQAQKEVFHNEALIRLDAIAAAGVEGPPQVEPPAAPQPGQAWIAAPAAAGDWAGQDGAIAAWTDGGWRFLQPPEGMLVWRRDTGQWMIRTAGGWQDDRFPVPALAVAGKIVVGPQQPAVTPPAGGGVVDAECRAALGAALEALRAHGLIAR